MSGPAAAARVRPRAALQGPLLQISNSQSDRGQHGGSEAEEGSGAERPVSVRIDRGRARVLLRWSQLA